MNITTVSKGFGYTIDMLGDDYSGEDSRELYVVFEHGCNSGEHIYLDSLWDELSDVAVDDDGFTYNDFYMWEAGTNREEIWLWFDAVYQGGIAKLMNLG